MTFEWKADYALGNRVIDEEHKILISLIDRFEVSLRENDGQAMARESLQGLDDYIRVHFLVEEELMKAYAYPGYTEHRDAHNQFRTAIHQYNTAFQESEMLMVNPIVVYLKKWLTVHILKVDRALSEFLDQNGMR